MASIIQNICRFGVLSAGHRLQPLALNNAKRLLSLSAVHKSHLISKKAPAFETNCLIGDKFKTVNQSMFDNKYNVLFFYPLDFTFVCPTELVAFEDHLSEFKAINCNVVACSVDSHFSHLNWNKMPRKEGGLGGVSYPILSDLTRQIATDYGVLSDKGDIALRGLFIIDSKGIVRHSSINDTGVGRNVQEVLRLVKAFQFHDEHGEVCPANWQPGSQTIKPDTSRAKEFFEKQ
ncbi:peroxiredoxin-2-like [Tubulanus polymorphus]|uniref:peroxiredoxin-2-like n=1 Tax=Tubulanus polymorphus TaxID=672921 RepID=UPI003DA5E9E8